MIGSHPARHIASTLVVLIAAAVGDELAAQGEAYASTPKQLSVNSGRAYGAIGAPTIACSSASGAPRCAISITIPAQQGTGQMGPTGVGWSAVTCSLVTHSFAEERALFDHLNDPTAASSLTCNDTSLTIAWWSPGKPQPAGAVITIDVASPTATQSFSL